MILSPTATRNWWICWGFVCVCGVMFWPFWQLTSKDFIKNNDNLKAFFFSFITLVFMTNIIAVLKMIWSHLSLCMCVCICDMLVHKKICDVFFLGRGFYLVIMYFILLLNVFMLVAKSRGWGWLCDGKVKGWHVCITYDIQACKRK